MHSFDRQPDSRMQFFLRLRPNGTVPPVTERERGLRAALPTDPINIKGMFLKRPRAPLGALVLSTHSHSMVAGGFPEMS